MRRRQPIPGSSAHTELEPPPADHYEEFCFRISGYDAPASVAPRTGPAASDCPPDGAPPAGSAGEQGLWDGLCVREPARARPTPPSGSRLVQARLHRPPPRQQQPAARTDAHVAASYALPLTGARAAACGFVTDAQRRAWSAGGLLRPQARRLTLFLSLHLPTSMHTCMRNIRAYTRTYLTACARRRTNVCNSAGACWSQ